MFAVLYSKQNYIYWVLSYPVDFNAPQEFWNAPSKAVHGEFHGSRGHKKKQEFKNYKTKTIIRGLGLDKLS